MAETIMPFDLDSFLEGLNKDCTKEKGTSNKVRRVIMNTRTNQGSVTILPFISKKIGNIYQKIENVREIYGPTSLIDAPDGAWFRILPKNYYGELTDKESELYDEVSGLYDEIAGYDHYSYDILRRRNYSIFTGICLNHINLEGNQIQDNLNEACLFVFPSNSPIDALNTAISNKKQVLKERTLQWLQGIITPSNTGRKGAIVITFKKSDGPGYSSSVSFETNNLDEGVVIIDPKAEFSEEVVSKFDDPLHLFLGWNYDYDNKKYFSEALFLELRDVLKMYLNEILNLPDDDQPEENLKNQNGNIDPMKNQIPPVPGVDQKPSNRPF